MQNLGLVGVKSIYGAYLQAHSDNGELHASNANRNEEETWILYSLDPAQKTFALMNWRNGKFISKLPPIASPGGVAGAIFQHLLGPNHDLGCARATATVLSNRETWTIVNAAPYGIANAVALKCAVDGSYLTTNSPGNDDEKCGGEVSARATGALPMNAGNWPGWWVIEPATPPSPGANAWNTIGGGISQLGSWMANNVSAADVAALVGLLA